MSVEFNFKIPAETEVIFDEEALKFLENLHNKFDGNIKEVFNSIYNASIYLKTLTMVSFQNF